MLLIGRELERLLTVLIAGLAVYLGFRLFYLAAEKQGELRVSGKQFSLRLADVAPGIYFALFGSAVLVFSLLSRVDFSQSSVEVTPSVKRSVQSRAIASDSIALGNPDYTKPYGRTFASGKESQFRELLAARELLASSLNNDSTALWRQDAIDILRKKVGATVSEKQYVELLSDARTPEQLLVFLESYLPYFVLRNSSPQAQ